MNSVCPLCGGCELSAFSHEAWRNKASLSHSLCLSCDLIFLRPDLRLSPVEEKARYDNHENSGDDEGYRSFLSPVVRLCSRLVPESGRPQLRVLDFGCGPHPALAHTLESKGFRVSLFDAFYRNDETVFAQKFDLIVSTEVFEHLYYPVIEIERLCRCLDETRGILVVMTQLHQGTDHFGRWWYGSDPSHVVFYSEKTLAWIQNKFKFNQFWVVSGKRELRVALP